MSSQKISIKSLVKNLEESTIENIRIIENENYNVSQVIIFAGKLAYKELIQNQEENKK